MHNKHYPKLGGDLEYGCERLAKGLGAFGLVAILYRGEGEQAELAMSFAPELKVDAAGFHELKNAILNNDFSASVNVANEGCLMLADATNAECVIMFTIEKDGSVQVAVSHPKSNEFVAAFAFQIANSIDAMN